MHRLVLLPLLLGFAAATVMATPASATVIQGGSTAGLDVFDFESVPNPLSPWTPYTTIPGPGFVIGEKLVGQINTPSGDLDVVSGNPSTPLAMDLSVPAENGVSVFVSGGPGNVNLGPEGPVGWSAGDSLGEGAWSVLFDGDQSVGGLDPSESPRLREPYARFPEAVEIALHV